MVFNREDLIFKDFLIENEIEIVSDSITDRLPLHGVEAKDGNWHNIIFKVPSKVVEDGKQAFFRVKLSEDFSGQMVLFLRIELENEDSDDDFDYYDGKVTSEVREQLVSDLEPLMSVLMSDKNKRENFFKDLTFRRFPLFNNIFYGKIESSLKPLDCFIQCWYLSLLEAGKRISNKEILDKDVEGINQLKNNNVIKKYYYQPADLIELMTTEENWDKLLELNYSV
jgi:hypothetical protein